MMSLRYITYLGFSALTFAAGKPMTVTLKQDAPMIGSEQESVNTDKSQNDAINKYSAISAWLKNKFERENKKGADEEPCTQLPVDSCEECESDDIVGPLSNLVKQKKLVDSLTLIKKRLCQKKAENNQ